MAMGMTVHTEHLPSHRKSSLGIVTTMGALSYYFVSNTAIAI